MFEARSRPDQFAARLKAQPVEEFPFVVDCNTRLSLASPAAYVRVRSNTSPVEGLVTVTRIVPWHPSLKILDVWNDSSITCCRPASGPVSQRMTDVPLPVILPPVFPGPDSAIVSDLKSKTPVIDIAARSRLALEGLA